MPKETEFQSAENLTVEELKESKIPDKYVTSVWSSFKSKKDRNYNAVHVFQHVDGPYILLCQTEKDKKDFPDVENIVERETRGSPKYHMTDRTNDICDVINLNRRITQAIVADFVKRYQLHFEGVAIPVAHFKNVPKSIFENSGLPSEKLKTC